ncbi:MAG TPA: ABC-2 family transporter protein [Kofleriaceae bacterium]|nr:ABC-2 family transporter protein [Kofleriaceae bacterium]
MHGLRLYRRYAAISIKSQLQYRASFIMTTIGAFLITGIDFLGILVLFDRFGQVRGWTLPEIAVFYGMISTMWALCDAIGRGFDTFGNTVKAGDFDRLLLRPRSTVLQLIGAELTLRRIGRLLQGWIVLGYAIVHLDVDWTAWRFGLMAFAIACGVCVFLAIVILQATSAFWTTETLEVWNAFTYGGVLMNQYPLAIYRSWFRKLFTYAIPLGCVAYLPGLAILGRADPIGWPLVAPLAGPLFLAIALALWRIGVRHYRSTGS